jgi:hypothetical protein
VCSFRGQVADEKQSKLNDDMPRAEMESNDG